MVNIKDQGEKGSVRLEDGDAALIIRRDGSSEMLLPRQDEEAEVEDNVMWAVAFGMLLTAKDLYGQEIVQDIQQWFLDKVDRERGED